MAFKGSLFNGKNFDFFFGIHLVAIVLVKEASTNTCS